MKITVEHIKGVENEVILRCETIDEEMLGILALLNAASKKIMGIKDGESHLLAPSEVLYCESVDDSNFVYTAKDVFATAYSLSELEMLFSDFGFLRCSKSTVINLNAIDRFKTEDGARINATMRNGEHIVISRHYAKLLRAKLEA